MMKGSIQGEDITIVNIYAPNIVTPQYIRQMLISTKGETDGNITMMGGLNTPLTPMDSLSRLRINKQACTLYDTLEQINLVTIYKTVHSKAAENTEHSPR